MDKSYQTCGYLSSCGASPPFDQYQIILLGGRNTCDNLLKVVTWKQNGRDSIPRPTAPRGHTCHTHICIQVICCLQEVLTHSLLLIRRVCVRVVMGWTWCVLASWQRSSFQLRLQDFATLPSRSSVEYICFFRYVYNLTQLPPPLLM